MRSHPFVLLLAAFMFSLTTLSNAAVIKRGTIQGKSVKWTQGSVVVERNGKSFRIKLGANFKTKRGPSLYVYVGNGSPQKRIGKLKSISGAQIYSVPSSLDVTKYSTLYIYCVPFQAVFGSAHLR